MGPIVRKLALLLAVYPLSVFCTPEVVAERGGHTACEEFAARGLKVFKDPTLFLPNLSQILEDPKNGWYRLMQETPLIGTITGRARLMRLGEPREFKNFGAIAKLYELVEPRLKVAGITGREKSTRIVPVQVCGDGTLGFVLEADLKRGAVADESSDGSMPPSVYPNPIPELRYPAKPRTR